MVKMNWARANKKQRTGKAQSDHADADHPTYSPEQEAVMLELYEQRILKKAEIIRQEEEIIRQEEELRLQKDLEELERRKVKRANFIEKNKLLLDEQIEILGCKPDCSDAWVQLKKLIKDNPKEKSKYWEAYHRLDEIVNVFY